MGEVPGTIVVDYYGHFLHTYYMNYMKILAFLAAALVLGGCSSTVSVKEKEVVDLTSPKIAAGTVEVQFEGIMSLGKIKAAEAAIDYYPEEDFVCINYRLDFISYFLYLSKENRAAVVTALENYKKDFAEKKLGKNSRKARRMYGSFRAYLIWQLHRYSIKARNYVDVELGYTIRQLEKNNVAFFTIFQCETLYEDEMSRDSNRTSPDIRIFLTIAQAESLVAMFDENFLQGIKGERFNQSANTSIGADVYSGTDSKTNSEKQEAEKND